MEKTGPLEDCLQPPKSNSAAVPTCFQMCYMLLERRKTAFHFSRLPSNYRTDLPQAPKIRSFVGPGLGPNALLLPGSV
ncbi:MAG: hypothetical protein C5B47_03040 [Verrucomicrobia bacterium]|nr:MAG: hypothetical protein C5B47_03040 [Verrucomicrobiota bacterium]